VKIIKCIKCGTFNTNKEYCKNCGTILSYQKRREEQLKVETSKKLEKIKKSPPSFIERLKEHNNLFYKAFGWLLYSGFLVVTAIGAFIAWLVFAIAAG
jgi:ribosomal protein L37E